MIKNNHITSDESAARFGAKANLLLGAGQFTLGLATGNYGFLTESVHQGSDAVSLQAKAVVMSGECKPKKARRLRKLAASVLVAGGLVGIGGGISHFANNTREDSGWVELSGAVIGAAVNTAIVRKSHNGTHKHVGKSDEEEHDHAHNAHQIGAHLDTTVHILTDMGTGWTYAAALALESHAPGISNLALVANGLALGAAGGFTFKKIRQDDRH